MYFLFLSRRVLLEMVVVLTQTSLPVYFAVFPFYQPHQQAPHMMMKEISTLPSFLLPVSFNPFFQSDI